MTRPWRKLWCDKLIASTRFRRSSFAARAVYLHLFVYADDDGSLRVGERPWTLSEVCSEFGMRRLADTTAAVEELVRAGMVTMEEKTSLISLTRFAEHQGAVAKPLFKGPKTTSQDTSSDVLPNNPATPQRHTELVMTTSYDNDSSRAHAQSEEKRREEELECTFKQFWPLWPRKLAKKDARKAWKQVDGPKNLDEILVALEPDRWPEYWRENNGRKIPFAGTWLRGERWNDEPESSNGVALVEEAWNNVVATIKSSEKPDFGPRTAAAVKAIGGLYNLRNKSSSEIHGWTKKRFFESFGRTT